MNVRRALIALALSVAALPAAGATAFAQQPAVATRLINTVNAYPSPSPDGKQIVYHSSATGRNELMIANADGTGIRQLTNSPGEHVSAAWSPDGQWIAFASSPEGRSEVFVIRPDGTDMRQLTNTPGDNSHPAWSGDGKRLFFNSGRATPDPSAPWGRQWHDIYSMNPDGTDVRKLTDCRTVCTFPSPSPDGTKLAYRKVTETPGMNWDLSSAARNSEVFVANADGSGERNISSSAAFDGWPAWSPDGTLIAFASNRVGPANTGQIFVVAPDGSGLRQVTSGPWSYTQPRWSRDSRRLYLYQIVDPQDGELGSIAVVDVPRAGGQHP